MVQGILFILIGIITGSAVSWLILKLSQGKSFVPAGVHEQLKQTCQQAEIRMAGMEAGYQNSLARQQELTAELKANEQQLHRLRAEIQTLSVTIARQETDIQSRQERLDLQKHDLEEMKQQVEAHFRLLANDILEAKARTFGEQQETKLTDLLLPLKDQMAVFKKEFDAKFTEEVREKSSLRAEIANLLSLNQTIAREAVSLTEALKGSTKKQGDWGEGILERILEFSGLQKGINYTVQTSSRDEQGRLIRPDMIVTYSEGRHLVIDSKVSLTHYWDYCNTSDESAQKEALKQMVRSLKSHVDALHGKDYIGIAGTPDFIIMFVPVEAAYITAMQEDHELWQYAYTRKVFLISPTNLIPAMKMISDVWQKDNLSRDAEIIAEKAVKLYEKLVGFVDNFESVGRELDRAHSRWQDARRQLHQGKGNLLTQGENLKLLLGNKTNKELPSTLLMQARLEDEPFASLDSEPNPET